MEIFLKTRSIITCVFTCLEQRHLPSCCNFALRKAAEDHQEEFGQDAARTLKRNFYVDDLLKSYRAVLAAISFIPKVRSMTGAGGFNLTQFRSNN